MMAFPRPRVRTVRRVARLGVECLEGREVPAAAYSLDTVVVLGVPADPSGRPVLRTEPVPAGRTVEDAVAAWAYTPGVASAQPNYLYEPALTPNDPSYTSGTEWGLNNTGLDNKGKPNGAKPDADIDAPEAWNLTTGSLATTLAVIDTGIDYTHPDLYLNIWLNQDEIPAAVRPNLTDTDADGRITFWDLNAVVNGAKVNVGPGKITDLNKNGYIDGGDVLKKATAGGWADGVDGGGNKYVDDIIGWDFANGDNDPMDDHGHGTHVAGTIGAMSDNKVGVAGVNWKAQIVPLKFMFASGGGDTADAAAAVDYSVAAGAFASNNSWGGKDADPALRASIAAAGVAGQVVVAAAGNNGQDADKSPFYPAAYDLSNVVSVAATDANDARASFSNYGAVSVDLGAPGKNVTSTYFGGGYASLSGTSMASPHVTGVFGLVHTLFPDLTAAQAIARVLGSVDPLPELAGKTVTGGRLNAFKALDREGPAVAALAPNATGPAAVSAVRLTFDEAVDPATFGAADVAVTGPTGAAVAVAGVAAVAGTGNTKFDVSFAPQAAAGAYAVTVGPDVRDAAGNPMDQNRDGANGTAADRYDGSFAVAPPASVTYANTTRTPLLDGGTTASTLTVDQDITVDVLTVALTVAHPNVSDLTVTLYAPNNAAIRLFARRGGAGQDLAGTVFDDAAAVAVLSGAAPFAGTFRPEQPLARFAGKAAKGTWRLTVGDYTAGNAGDLLGWSLTFKTAETIGPSVASVVPNGTGPVSSVRVTFDEAIDAATFAPADVAVADPAGAAVAVTGVTPVGTAGTAFDVSFAPQAAAGAYAVTVGPDVRDPAGNKMDQNHNGTNGEDPADRYTGTFAVGDPAPPAGTTFANGTRTPLPDIGSTTSTLAVDQDLTVGTLTVALTVAHANVSDLTVTLYAPDGTSTRLFARRGRNGDNLTGTVFDDAASTGVAAGAAPFAGSFRPEQPLARFAGKAAKGTWRLVLGDYIPGNAGVLENWSITIS